MAHDDVENQIEPSSSSQLRDDTQMTRNVAHLRHRAANNSPHHSPARSSTLLSLTDEDRLEIQVVSIPSHPDSSVSMPAPSGPHHHDNDNMSNVVTSSQTLNPDIAPRTAIDDPFYQPPAKSHPTFVELQKQHGFVGACSKMSSRIVKDYWGILLFLLFLAVGLAFLGIFAFDPLPWKAWVAYAIFCVTLSLLVSNAISTPLAMLFGLTAMLAFQIVTPTQGIEGFSNTGVISVAILFIVAEGIQRTSVLTPIFRVVLGKPRYLWEAQLRVMLPVAVVSAFLNNTPLVAMLIPVVQSWSRRARFPVSKLLMPLNNAAVLGGTLTLLGTSTNLVVDGLARDAGFLKNSEGEVTGLPIFGIAPVGAISLLVGLIYMTFFSRFLLRDRGQAVDRAINRNPREYTVALLVQDRSPIVGETVLEAGLRQLQGLFLVEITRADGTLIPAVAPTTKIESGDVLLFAGIVETVTELYHIPGLVPATGQSQKMKLERHHRRLVELVISSSSMLAGKTAKESKFRSRFSAAIIAVHRHGEHVKEKIADIKLRPGDTLLIETGSDFISRYGKDSNFALVSEVSGSQPPRGDRFHMIISALLTVTMVALATANVLPLLSAAATVSFLMVMTGCLTASNAAQSVNLAVVVTIAASFGIANGMKETGAAEQLANFIVRIFEPLGSIGVLFGIYVGTALLSSVITNNAAVALMFPLIVAILKKQGLVDESGDVVDENKVLRTLYTLMLGASSSFSTPIGYQTNLMVHGPGGYTFMDWVIFGIPMQVLLCVAGVLSVNMLSFSL